LFFFNIWDKKKAHEIVFKFSTNFPGCSHFLVFRKEFISQIKKKFSDAQGENFDQIRDLGFFHSHTAKLISAATASIEVTPTNLTDVRLRVPVHLAQALASAQILHTHHIVH
jgi:hypothetical protein